MNTNIDSNILDLEKRKKIQAILKGSASFLRLKEDSKMPRGKYAPGSRNRLKNVPKDGNFGIIPDKDIFILDIDCHDEGKMTVEEQVKFFSQLLDTDLNETFSIVTPSGGRHYYLRFPSHVLAIAKKYRIPKASLRYFNNSFTKMLDKDFNVIDQNDAGAEVEHLSMADLDADIRTGLITGYVVGPGSVIDGIEYEILNDTDNILEISKKALQRLDAVVRNRDNERSEKKRAALIEKAKLRGEKFKDIDQAIFEVEENAEVYEAPSAAAITSLRAKLDERKKENPDIRFHAQRAFVKAALHCCYSDYAIAIACVELGIDSDRHTTSKISFKQLYKDISRISPVQKYHGSYCQKGKLLRNAQREEDRLSKIAKGESTTIFDLDSYLLNLKNKVVDGKLSQRNRDNRIVDPRVVDVAKIATAIAGENHSFIQTIQEGRIFSSREKQDKTLSDQFWNAIRIVDYYIQPLLNVGAKYIMLAKNSIIDKLEMSDSQATQALRVLRKHEVILIERKQRTGVPALYAVNEKFVNVQLTKTLKRTWGRSQKIKQGTLNEVTGKTGKMLHEEKILDHLPIYFDRFSSSFREVFSGSHILSDLDRIIDTEEDDSSKDKKKIVHVSITASRISQFMFELERIEALRSPKKFEFMSETERLQRTRSEGSGAAKHYLKEEREMLGLKIVHDLVILEKTGEIVEPRNIDKINTIVIDTFDDINDFDTDSFEDDFAFEIDNELAQNDIIEFQNLTDEDAKRDLDVSLFIDVEKFLTTLPYHFSSEFKVFDNSNVIYDQHNNYINCLI